MKIEIMYFGRASDRLMMTSERMDVLDEVASLKQLLNKLRARGSSWAYELDESYVFCTINEKLAEMSDALKEGDEIDIFSRKSLFEL